MKYGTRSLARIRTAAPALSKQAQPTADLSESGAPTDEVDLLSQWEHFGEVPMIFGSPPIEFDPFVYAAEVAPTIYVQMNTPAR